MKKGLLTTAGILCILINGQAFSVSGAAPNKDIVINPVIVTATRYEDPSLNISGNVTVIDEQEIRDSGARYVPDVLRKTAGINVSDFIGNGKTTRVDMRGYGDSAGQNVLVLVDGRRTNQIDLSGADWTQIDPESIERIEIVRGAQSVLYGDNATGGVINIITKSGKGKKPSVGYNQKLGSYKYSSEDAYVEGGSDFLDYYASASTSYDRGHRINSHFETVDYAADMTMKPAEYFNVRSSFGYHKDFYGLPSAVKPVDINRIGREGSISPDNRGKTEDYYVMFTPEYKDDLGFGEMLFSSDLIARQRRTQAVYYSTWGNSLNTHHISSFGITPKAAFTKEFFGVTNRMIAGFDYYSNKDEIDSGLMSSMDSLIIDKDTTGIYITDTVELPCSVIVNGGFRGEWANYKFDQSSQIAGKHTKNPFEYAYELGLTYKYNDKSSVYAKYDRSFRFPTTDEWYTSLYIDYFSGLIAGGLNLNLKPQVAHNYEIGIKENTLDFLSVSADYYISDIKHELYYDPLTYMNSVYQHTVHNGLELEADIFLFDSLVPFVNYTFQKSYFVGGAYAGNDIPLVPRQKVSAGFNYTFKDCVTFGYWGDFAGERYFINDLQNAQPLLKRYITQNMRIGYEKHGFKMFLAVNNIFDEQYSEYGVLDTFTLSMPGYYPSRGRNFVAGVNYEF